MRQNIKIIVSDLDGTLLSPREWLWGKVRTYTLSALNVFLEDGDNQLIIATGRNLVRAQAISEWLQERLGGYQIPYLICLNGGLLYNNKVKKIVHLQCFQNTQLLNLIRFLRRNFLIIYLILNSEDQIFTENSFLSRYYGKKFAKRYNAQLLFNSEENYEKGWENVQKVVLISLQRNASKLRALIESKFKEFYVAVQGEWLLEIIDRKTNKFFALQKILELENWKLSECCAIGNEHNDVLMIEQCGVGVGVDFEHKSFNYDAKLVDFYTTNKSGKAVGLAINQFK